MWFPRGTMRNGLIEGTKMQSSKRKGNLFWFLCIAHRTNAKTILKNSLQLFNVRWGKFIHFLKSYLAMEEWFHDSNDKDKIHNTRDEIAKVLTSLHFFPQDQITQTTTAYPKCMEWQKCSHTSSFLGVEWISMEDWVKQLTRSLSSHLVKKHKDRSANLLNKLHTNSITWCYQRMSCNTSERMSIV